MYFRNIINPLSRILITRGIRREIPRVSTTSSKRVKIKGSNVFSTISN